MGSRVTEPPLAGLSFPREPRESSQRMGRLVLWLALAVLLPAPAILQPLDQAVLEEQEQMRELLTSMFIDNHREGRDLEEDMDEEAVGEPGTWTTRTRTRATWSMTKLTLRRVWRLCPPRIHRRLLGSTTTWTQYTGG